MTAIQFALTARLKPIEASYGIDLILQFHRYTSIVACLFILAHPLILFVDNPTTLQLLNFPQAPSLAGEICCYRYCGTNCDRCYLHLAQTPEYSLRALAHCSWHFSSNRCWFWFGSCIGCKQLPITILEASYLDWVHPSWIVVASLRSFD